MRMFARLCRLASDGDLKRRHWNVDEEIRNEETEQVNLEEDNDSPKEDACTLQEVDLVANCPLLRVTTPRTPSPARSTHSSIVHKSMGQRPSTLLRPKISLTWVLRGQQHQHNDVNGSPSIPDAQIIRKSKDRSSRRSVKSAKSIKSIKTKESAEIIDRDKHDRCNVLQEIDKIVRHEKPAKELNKQPDNQPANRKVDAEQLEKDPQDNDKVKRAVSEPTLALKESSTREKHHRHRRAKRNHKPRPPTRFGYEIADLDSFLTKASIERPANIPVVLSFPTTLYQTQGGVQDEIALPLGTVVNAVFKNQAWLYVQTPHGQEGYVGYAACLPLGILPQPTCGPCWEDSTDVFPRPLGNMTDTEKLRDTRSECGARERTSRVKRGHRDAVSACGERSVDRLYLRAAANARTKGSRQTLLVIRSDYEGRGNNSISVSKGDVVALLSDHVQGWFWVRSRDSREGFIPAVIAGHGFL
ncbi:uncharacterized protein LOC130665686 isoform X1 [Microplitis mediator]|uniref:uncharacterized protein LOC130665686 isoform X1 n=2 Tax=Microplitis mediator TaxID=375433 RepID=UPI002555292B|nr:uncharacterized protein LOC130665686 isoform X1 [Microplitis mediator]XP_057322162.1 uncharacterized protein LOC130665686 isoform X1 [Microplitis mediator]